MQKFFVLVLPLFAISTFVEKVYAREFCSGFGCCNLQEKFGCWVSLDLEPGVSPQERGEEPEAHQNVHIDLTDLENQQKGIQLAIDSTESVVLCGSNNDVPKETESTLPLQQKEPEQGQGENQPTKVLTAQIGSNKITTQRMSPALPETVWQRTKRTCAANRGKTLGVVAATIALGAVGTYLIKHPHALNHHHVRRPTHKGGVSKANSKGGAAKADGKGGVSKANSKGGVSKADGKGGVSKANGNLPLAFDINIASQVLGANNDQ